MRFLPIGLETDNKKFLIIGGGYMALPIVKTLLHTEASIYLIAEEVMEEIKNLAEHSDRLKIKEESITEDFAFLGYDFLFIATHNFELNNSLELRARNRHMLYERLDILSYSSMSLGKIVEKGSLCIGIHSSKTNPTLSEMLEKDIQNLLDRKYPIEKINVLNDIRHELVRKNATHIDDIITTLFHEEVINIHTFKEGLSCRNVEDMVSGESLLADIKKGNFRSFSKEESNHGEDLNVCSEEESAAEKTIALEKKQEDKDIFKEKTPSFPRNYSFAQDQDINFSDNKKEQSIKQDTFSHNAFNPQGKTQITEFQNQNTDQFLDGEGLMRTPYEKSPLLQKSSKEKETLSTREKIEVPSESKSTLHNQKEEMTDSSPQHEESSSEEVFDSFEISQFNTSSPSEAPTPQQEEELPPVLEVEKKQNSTRHFELKSLRERFFPSLKKEKKKDQRKNFHEQDTDSDPNSSNSFFKHSVKKDSETVWNRKPDLKFPKGKNTITPTNDDDRWEAMIHREDASNTEKTNFIPREVMEESSTDTPKIQKDHSAFQSEKDSSKLHEKTKTDPIATSIDTEWDRENKDFTSLTENALERNITPKQPNGEKESLEDGKKKVYKPMTYDEIIKS